jgi:hypothetical protein
VSPRKQVRNRLEADYLTRRPVDHTAPLPPAVIGRGTDRMSADGIDATYTDAPDTRYGIGSAGVAVERPVVFEEPLMAYLAEQDGDAP